MEGQIEVAERRAVEERWNEEAWRALEAIITSTEDAIKETRALIAKIDEVLARRRQLFTTKPVSGSRAALL